MAMSSGVHPHRRTLASALAIYALSFIVPINASGQDRPALPSRTSGLAQRSTVSALKSSQLERLKSHARAKQQQLAQDSLFSPCTVGGGVVVTVPGCVSTPLLPPPTQTAVVNKYPADMDPIATAIENGVSAPATPNDPAWQDTEPVPNEADEQQPAAEEPEPDWSQVPVPADPEAVKDHLEKWSAQAQGAELPRVPGEDELPVTQGQQPTAQTGQNQVQVHYFPSKHDHDQPDWIGAAIQAGVGAIAPQPVVQADPMAKRLSADENAIATLVRDVNELMTANQYLMNEAALGGRPGPPGPEGEKGPAGPPGPPGKSIEVDDEDEEDEEDEDEQAEEDEEPEGGDEAAGGKGRRRRVVRRKVVRKWKRGGR